MFVSVNLNGFQRRVTSMDQIQIPVAEKTRVTDVLSYIRECYPDIPIRIDAVLVTINNEISNLDRVLEHNDQVSFIPHLGGG
jgi:molybdopterin converting factor small subunit